MPIYEFECEACDAHFDDLVAAGTERAPCPECGSTRTKRRFSAPSPTFKLVKSPGNARKQEAKNARLHSATKARFKESRRRHREARRKGKPGG
jgi:putative FmdB family regulatory protein